jgi:predicted permease
MSRRIFALLLLLFPPHFRRTYGDGMREVFVDQLAAARRTGLGATLAFWIRTFGRMPLAAWRERTNHTRRRWSGTFEALWTDLRLTGRALVRAPLFSLVSVSVVAIGIGGVATITAGTNALVLRPLPGTTNGAALYTIDRRTDDWSEGVSISGALYRHFAATTTTLDGLAVWSRVDLSLRSDNDALSLAGNIVSANYFDVLGLSPALGRFFDDDDADTSLVMSYRIWTSVFNSSPDIIGRTVTINGRPYTVLGVTPEGFRGVFTPLRIDAWVPLRAQPHVRPGRDLEQAPWLWMFGRLAPDISTEQSRAELIALLSAWRDSPGADRYTRYTSLRFTPLTGLPDDARQAIFGFAGMLLAAAIVVLLIAGANVSSLLATRATARRHEMGLRTALGAGRGRLVRQLLTETLVLFSIGAAGGLALAYLGTSALESMTIPGNTGLMLELSPDLRVVLGIAALGVVAGLIFGIGPALRGTATNPSELMRESTAGAGSRRSRLTSVLLVAQLAGSLMLITVTGLLAGALSRGASMQTGFDDTGVHTSIFNTESFGYQADQGEAFYASLERRLRETPGIHHVAFAHVAPLVSTPSNGRAVVGDNATPVEFSTKETRVGPGFFDTLDIPLRTGRQFETSDYNTASPLVIVNTTFAQRAWPDEANPVGRTFLRGATRVTVIGVADEVTWGTLDETAEPLVYSLLPRAQADRTLFVGAEPGVPVARLVVDLVRDLDPALPAPVVSTLAADTSVALFPQRVAAAITSTLGIGALTLAGAGLYGAMAFLVAARTREIGVRMALGATTGQVVRHVLHDGLQLTAVGIVVGLVGSIGAAQVVSGLLLGGDSLNWGVFGGAALTIAVTALFACLLPARRATRVSPSNVLRQ